MSGPPSRLRYPLALLLALQTLAPLPTAFAQSYRDIAKEAALKGENEKAVINYELALSSATKLFKENDIEIVIRRGELGEATAPSAGGRRPLSSWTTPGVAPGTMRKSTSAGAERRATSPLGSRRNWAAPVRPQAAMMTRSWPSRPICPMPNAPAGRVRFDCARRVAGRHASAPATG
ncbi:hypothetical protein [Verrucomicrobium spinosum]|uniref:hypothetical protein n=1 Tax=Verrucomicrobium spinosum TaxID=2736 RepID=UPI000A775D4D|nr:hypothetical protein [Verrucomicrobium spinosum]